MRTLTSKLLGAISLSALLPSRGGRVGLFLSVCKGKQVYSENNRFSGYWSNKFRKHHCNYLFYREISIIKKKPPQAPTASPDPSERRGVPMRTRGIRGRALYLIVFCKILANLHSPPFGGVGGGFSLSEGSGEAFYSQSQNHNHKITKRIFNV